MRCAERGARPAHNPDQEHSGQHEVGKRGRKNRRIRQEAEKTANREAPGSQRKPGQMAHNSRRVASTGQHRDKMNHRRENQRHNAAGESQVSYRRRRTNPGDCRERGKQ